jgi:hypothetical protein
MKSYTISLFDLILEKLKDEKGYNVVSLSDENDDIGQIFHFETKEEFELNFEIAKHPYYPGNMIIPKNNIFSIISHHNLYLIVDGNLMNKTGYIIN